MAKPSLRQRKEEQSNLDKSTSSKTRSGEEKWTLPEHPGCGGSITVLKNMVLGLDRGWLRYSPGGERKQTYKMEAHQGAIPIE